MRRGEFIEKDFNAFTDLSNRWSIRYLSRNKKQQATKM